MATDTSESIKLFIDNFRNRLLTICDVCRNWFWGVHGVAFVVARLKTLSERRKMRWL